MFYETSKHILENNYEKLQNTFLSSIDMEFNLGRNIDYLSNPLNKLSSEIENILNEMFEYCCKIHNIKNSIKNKYIKKFITSNEIYFYITKELDINLESIYRKSISLESKRIEINKYSKEQNPKKNIFKKALKTILLELILPGSSVATEVLTSGGMELYKDIKKQNINGEIKKLDDEISSEILDLYNDIINIAIPKIIIDLDKKYIQIYNQNNKKYSKIFFIIILIILVFSYYYFNDLKSVYYYIINNSKLIFYK